MLEKVLILHQSANLVHISHPPKKKNNLFSIARATPVGQHAHICGGAGGGGGIPNLSSFLEEICVQYTRPLRRLRPSDNRAYIAFPGAVEDTPRDTRWVWIGWPPIAGVAPTTLRRRRRAVRESPTTCRPTKISSLVFRIITIEIKVYIYVYSRRERFRPAI